MKGFREPQPIAELIKCRRSNLRGCNNYLQCQANNVAGNKGREHTWATYLHIAATLGPKQPDCPPVTASTSLSTLSNEVPSLNAHHQNLQFAQKLRLAKLCGNNKQKGGRQCKHTSHDSTASKSYFHLLVHCVRLSSGPAQRRA